MLWSVPTRPTRALTAFTAPAATDVGGLGEGRGATAGWAVVDIEGSGRTGVPGVDCAYGLVGCDEEQVIRTDGEDIV